jgi:hypothetical protein
MYWQKWSDRLRKELKLGTEPVAVTFAGALSVGSALPEDSSLAGIIRSSVRMPIAYQGCNTSRNV